VAYLGRGAFEDLLGHYMRAGHYVWSSPTEFVLGAEVVWDGQRYFIDPPNANAWFIHLAARADGIGVDPGAFKRLAPRQHPWVLFHRRGRLRVYRWSQFAEFAEFDRQILALRKQHGNDCRNTDPSGLRPRDAGYVAGPD